MKQDSKDIIKIIAITFAGITLVKMLKARKIKETQVSGYSPVVDVKLIPPANVTALKRGFRQGTQDVITL